MNLRENKSVISHPLILVTLALFLCLIKAMPQPKAQQ